MKHLITLKDWPEEDILGVLDLADRIKKSPEQFYDAMSQRVLVMIFEKPSLRTRISFETGMYQMGGHAIYYDMASSPLGTGKETIHDTVKTLSRYSDLIMARLFAHKNIEEMAQHSDIPVINGLTDFNHPCQILSDLMTIREKKGKLNGLKLAYLGDAKNNVTHSLLYGCSKMGITINVGCPKGENFSPLRAVMDDCREICNKSGAIINLTNDPLEAVKDADIIYTDSWMSYHINPKEREHRVQALKPYQVDTEKVQLGAPDLIFMNCLPAMRGYEQTADVIDGRHSVVFQQAENRLHCQKAIMVKLLKEFMED
jgi:ornithine carbamoyltransferase